MNCIDVASRPPGSARFGELLDGAALYYGAAAETSFNAGCQHLDGGSLIDKLFDCVFHLCLIYNVFLFGK